MAQQTIYLTEIHSDDDEAEELTHNGEEVERLQPIEVPVETLTAAQVAAANNAAAPAGSAAGEAAKLRGNAAFGAGRYEEAVVAYTEAIELCPEAMGLAWGNRSAARLKLDRTEEAIADAEEMVRLLPEIPKAHFRLGSALAAAGRHAAAAAAFAEMLRLEPTSDVAEEALRKQMAAGNVKKNKKHVKLLQTCQAALAARKGARPAPAAPAPAAARPRGAALAVKWAKPFAPAKGAARPCKRAGATLSLVGGRLWLLGGADREGNVCGDVWEYALSEEQARACGCAAGVAVPGWREHAAAAAGEAPLFTPRAAHAAACVEQGAAGAAGGDVLLVHGGHQPHSSALYADLLEMRPAATGGDGAPSWRAPPTRGAAPDARNGHSLSWDAAARAALLFGGADDEGHRDDLHQLQRVDGDAWEWRAPQCTGAPPAAREMHAAAVVGGALLVHGGRGGPHGTMLDDVGVLCLRSLAWSSSATRLCRAGHAAVLLPPLPPAAAAAASPPRLLVLGGVDGSSLRLDAWQLALPAAAAAAAAAATPATGAPPAKPPPATADAPPAASEVLVERGRSEGEPRGRFAHAACGAGACVFIFGGSTKEAEDADLVHALVS